MKSFFSHNSAEAKLYAITKCFGENSAVKQNTLYSD